MGSVTPYETSSGRRYRVRYRTPDHRQTDKRGFQTRKQADLFLASVEVSKARGEFIDPGAARESIASLGSAWLSNQVHLKPSSRRPIEIAWRLYVKPMWGTRQVGQIRHSEVQEWANKLAHNDGQPRSATTVSRAYGVLAAILDVAVRDRRILSNPARGVKLPRKTAREHVYLNHDQAHALAAGSGDHGTLVLVLVYTGLRWGEAIGLRVKDVDLRRARLNVVVNAVEVGGEIEVGTPKSHKRRSVPFPTFLATRMTEQIAGKHLDDLVFGAKDGEHLRRTRVSAGSPSWFKTALRDAGLEPMTIHDLRHTAASLAISAGANVKAVQRMLGHASAAMTLDTYSDLFDDDLGAVAVRLNEAFSNSVVGKAWAQARPDGGKAPESK